MKIVCNICLILSFLFGTNQQGHTQKSGFGMEAVYVPALSTIITTKTDDFSYDLFHTLGIRGLYSFNENFYLGAGLFLRSTGTGERSPRINNLGEVSIEDAKLIYTSISASVIGGYHLINKEKYRVAPELGIMNDDVIKIERRFKSGESGGSFKDQFIFSIHTGINFGYNLSEKLVLQIRPNLQYQLNERDYNLFTFGLGIGVLNLW